MRARLTALFLLAAAGLLSPATANADVIRCNDANGNTLYTDSACPAGMRAGGVTPVPLPCATEDCERRRERDLKEAHERVRGEQEQLAAYTEERHKRESEERWLDEARYEAGLRGMQSTPDEAAYPAYPVVGIPSRCGMHCVAFPHSHRLSISRIGNVDRAHHHMKGAGTRREIRGIGNEPRRPTAGRRAGFRD